MAIGEPTLHDILEALARPGRDPREDLPPPIFKKGILKLEDLQPGMELKGTVLNVVDFGAFVDIGLKDSGLVHISQMANRYIKSPYDVVAVGDVVTVWVLQVDQERRRVSLSMIRPGSERKPAERKPKDGAPRVAEAARPAGAAKDPRRSARTCKSPRRDRPAQPRVQRPEPTESRRPRRVRRRRPLRRRPLGPRRPHASPADKLLVRSLPKPLWKAMSHFALSVSWKRFLKQRTRTTTRNSPQLHRATRPVPSNHRLRREDLLPSDCKIRRKSTGLTRPRKRSLPLITITGTHSL